MALTDKLTAIGEAIRSKTGTTDLLTLDGMAEAVNGLEVGGGGYPNGTKWTKNQGVYQITNVLYSKGIWVGYRYDNTSSYTVQYSSDGINWSGSNLSGKYLIVEYNDAIGKWIAGCGSGVYISSDGATWEQSDYTSSIFNASFLQYGKFIILCNSGAPIAYSVNGMNWTAYTTENISGYTTILSAAGLLISGNFNKLKYSNDGITWSNCTIPSSGFGSVEALAYANGTFLVATSNNGMYYSYDGITWTQTSITGMFSESVRLAHHRGMFYASSSGHNLQYSVDGVTWVTTDVTLNSTATFIDYFSALIMSVGYTYYYSEDGITWNKLELANKGPISCANGIAISVGGGTTGSSSGVLYSFDGINWHEGSSDVVLYRTIKNVNGIWFSNDYNGFLYYSPTWLPPST